MEESEDREQEEKEIRERGRCGVKEVIIGVTLDTKTKLSERRINCSKIVVTGKWEKKAVAEKEQQMKRTTDNTV